ncbi:MAG: polysaccharide biosynthesis protein [Clostridiales bacterium]|nr:polysaccharide biosynthesis protein [Clostridiales bacterium]
MSQRKNQTMLNGALILSLAVLIVKIIGAVYKIPLTSLIGGVGRGYYNSAYEIYLPIYAISMAGLPVAVSRLVSENVALKRYREAESIFKTALKMFILIGVVGSLLIVAVAFPYTKFIAGAKNLPAVLAIAPSLFFCCVMAAYRGYYEGLRNMKPTAISQVLEAIAKLGIGLGLAYFAVSIGLKQYDTGLALLEKAVAAGLDELPQIYVFGQAVKDLPEAHSVIYPISAAGAILGVTSGTFFGAIYLSLKHRFTGSAFSKEELALSPVPSAGKDIAKNLLKVATPIIMSSLVLSITNLIDTLTIQARLAYALGKNAQIIKEMYATSFSAAKILDSDIVKYLWGVHGSATDFKNLIPTLIISLGVSALPAMAAAWVVKDKSTIKSTTETVIRITMLVALPAGIGIGVMARPILTLIYGSGSSADIIPVAVPLVAAYGYSTALFSVSTPITNMLQAIGRADIPLKSLALGAGAKILINYFLVGNPQVNIMGAPIASIVCYIIIVAINLIYLIKLTQVKLSFSSIFVKPLVAALLCGLTAKISYSGLLEILTRQGGQEGLKVTILATAVAVSLAVLVFAVCILSLKGLVKEDVISLPKGEKIAKVLEKYRLLG